MKGRRRYSLTCWKISSNVSSKERHHQQSKMNKVHINTYYSIGSTYKRRRNRTWMHQIIKKIYQKIKKIEHKHCKIATFCLEKEAVVILCHQSLETLQTTGGLKWQVINSISLGLLANTRSCCVCSTHQTSPLKCFHPSKRSKNALNCWLLDSTAQKNTVWGRFSSISLFTEKI